jgi:uncharacterized iron-regulated protein
MKPPLLIAWLASVLLCSAAAAGAQQDTGAVIRHVADNRVVFIGEEHETYGDHLSQLELIQGLHKIAPERWTIGVEYIQRRFQLFLDAYITGTISEREFLIKTEYFDRWGYDYRLYRPIFRYAREQHIPMVALNAERELTDEVSKLGLEGLPAADRARLPHDIENSDTAYRERLRKAFDEHPDATAGNFDRFVEVQSTWDETMAERVADYLAEHPDKAMIVLAGSGHTVFDGIPSRVRRRLPGIQTAILQPSDLPGFSNASLPPAGKMGIVMDLKGSVAVKSVAANGAAARAGVRPGDRIVAIDGQPIRTLGDVRLALLDKEPGQQLSFRLEREAVGTPPQQIDVELTLGD